MVIKSVDYSSSMWINGPVAVTIPSGAIDVWRIPLWAKESELAECLSVLSEEEVAIIEKFSNNKLKSNYIVSHYALRDILHRYLACSPGDLNFKKTIAGKPKLEGGMIYFNLSHSHEFAAVAVTLCHEVGVDIEFCGRDVEFLSIARRFFTENEYKQVKLSIQLSNQHAFFTVWTLKEAFLKALGLGLSGVLKDFDVSIHGSPQLLGCATAMGRVSDWTLRSFAFGEGYTGAVASKSEVKTWRYFDWLLRS